MNAVLVEKLHLEEFSLLFPVTFTGPIPRRDQPDFAFVNKNRSQIGQRLEHGALAIFCLFDALDPVFYLSLRLLQLLDALAIKQL